MSKLASFVEFDGLVDATFDALGRGRREITHPRSIAPAYRVKAIAPEFMRRQVRRTTLDAAARERREAEGD